MTNHNQVHIIQEQMKANRRIIKAAKTGQYIARSPLSDRIKQFTKMEIVSPHSSPGHPKSKKK